MHACALIGKAGHGAKAGDAWRGLASSFLSLSAAAQQAVGGEALKLTCWHSSMQSRIAVAAYELRKGVTKRMHGTAVAHARQHPLPTGKAWRKAYPCAAILLCAGFAGVEGGLRHSRARLDTLSRRE